ncbi:MAG: hypothetical protein ACJAQS_000341 [Porticoccus sp.]|jgi:hypothetical protein
MVLHAGDASYRLSGFKKGRILTGLANISHADEKKERIEILFFSGLTTQRKAVQFSCHENNNNIIKINNLR